MTLREALSRRLLEAAHRFEANTPKCRRIESERQALRDVMTDAQLVLSVQEHAETNTKAGGTPVTAGIPFNVQQNRSMTSRHRIHLSFNCPVMFASDEFIGEGTPIALGIPRCE